VIYKEPFRKKSIALLLTVFLIAVPAFLQSCGGGGGGYDNPQTQAAASSVLISPQTLNSWVTNGYGTDSAGYNHMVILDAAPAASYTTFGHVPGAFHVDTSEIAISRSDGIGGSYTNDTGTVTDINTPGMVATSGMMNAVIQRTGINQNTVVVITGDSLFNISKTYFNFRYWGFPKERLKVLDRTKALYQTAGFSLQTSVPPAPEASTYSVSNLTPNTSLRATLSDMIQVAEGTDPNSIAWDVRTLNEFNGVAGSTAGPLGNPKKVAFEGHVKGAKHLNYVDLLVPGTTPANSAILEDVNAVKALLAAAEITSDKRTHMY
jgi:3-mercaptopyruvate sulfurtransferase SseA